MQAVLVQTVGAEVGRRWVVPLGQRVTIGRADEVEVQIHDRDASRQHAALACTPRGIQVVDLGSRNGTYLGNRRLPPHQPQVAAAQDTIRIGGHVIEVRMMAPQAGGAAPPAASEQPRLRDMYELVRELGEGAAGTVYEARHRVTGQHVAIKGLHAKVAQDDHARQRFLREGRVRVDHENVVTIYDMFLEGDHAYVVMEMVRGGCVRDLLVSARGPLPLQTAVHLALQTARGLEAVHAAGIIHRDIKPANLLLTEERLLKIGDFGLAKPSDQMQSLTATGQGMGSMAYMSPEQAEDAKRVEPPADLYSLGATLYHLLAGRPPFTTTTMEILVEILEIDPPPITTLRPDCPPELAELVHSLLAKDYDDRPPTAKIVAKELEAALSQLSGSE